MNAEKRGDVIWIPNDVPDPRLASLEHPTPVVGMGAFLQLDPPQGDMRKERSFHIAEFIDLELGPRVMLRRDRGWTTRWDAYDEAEVRAALTTQRLIDEVSKRVRPEDEPDEQPGPSLAKRAQAHGLAVTEADLEKLPYELIITQGVTEWLRDGTMPT